MVRVVDIEVSDLVLKLSCETVLHSRFLVSWPVMLLQKLTIRIESGGEFFFFSLGQPRDLTILDAFLMYLFPFAAVQSIIVFLLAYYLQKHGTGRLKLGVEG